jgi:predicted choloylglycine hydrolase
MKNIILIIPICFLLISPIICFYNFSNENIKNEPVRLIENNFDPLDGGWFKEENGVKILHLNGTNFMMGYQYGYFMKNEIEEFSRLVVEFFEKIGCSYERFLEIWNIMEKYTPKYLVEEMKGMSNGSNLPIEDIIIINTAPAVLNIYTCSGLSAWGSATRNGEVIHFRSFDFTLNIKDEETGKYAQEYQAIVVRDPYDGYSSVSFSWIGDVGSWGGFNEKGIAVGEASCKTDDTTYEGISIAFRMRAVLDNASTMEEAVDILNSNKDCGWNVILSDINNKKGVVIEQTASKSYIGSWNNKIESTYPFYKIKEVVRRTNLFINPSLAKTQRQHYNPRGFIGLFRFLFKQDFYFFEWQHYKALSRGIIKYHGSLDLETTMDMVREVYSGETNLIFRYFQKRGGKQDIHQWVANPKTGDFLISFASIEKCAHETTIHSFNLYDLLDLSLK